MRSCPSNLVIHSFIQVISMTTTDSRPRQLDAILGTICYVTDLFNEENSPSYSQSPGESTIETLGDEELFKEFLNKLGHACDYKTKGKTVTSFMLLHNSEDRQRVTFYFTSNTLKSNKLEDLVIYLRLLFEIVHSVTEQTETEDRARKRLFARVLTLNKEMVTMYVRNIRNQLITAIQTSQQLVEDTVVEADGTLIYFPAPRIG